MIKTLRSVMIIMLSMGVLLGLCSCRMKESYKEFKINNITDNLHNDYFTTEEFSFARIQDVVIIPEVKAINHGEYVIYISVYSKNGKESVQIKNVVFKEKETILFNNELDKKIEFKENAESIYEGWTDGGTFTEESLKVADGKKYDLVIEVEVIKNGAHISENITFEIVVKGYKSFVWPT